MRAILAVLTLLLALVPARADVAGFEGRTTLVMVDAIDCGYCRKWDREVGVGYPKSEEGRIAPLTKIRRGDARLKGFSGLAYTPTFILVVNGQERGRIVGYAGADFFWGELDRLIKRGPVVPDVRAQAQDELLWALPVGWTRIDQSSTGRVFTFGAPTKF